MACHERPASPDEGTRDVEAAFVCEVAVPAPSEKDSPTAMNHSAILNGDLCRSKTLDTVLSVPSLDMYSVLGILRSTSCGSLGSPLSLGGGVLGKRSTSLGDLGVDVAAKLSWRHSSRSSSSSQPRKLASLVKAAESDRSSSSDPLSTKVADLLSFSGCPELLRGTFVRSALRCGSSLFRDSAGSGSTYELSDSVPAIDSFISHNWCVPRWSKFIVLALHFNFKIAVVTSIVVVHIIAVLNCTGAMPVITSRAWNYPRTFVAMLVMVPTFLCTLLFVRDLPIRSCQNTRVFVDKACIHQTDRDVQAQGIKKLGAFLCYSNEMLVIYTDVYLTKLWTCYEVASFMALHPMHQMVIATPVAASMFLKTVLLIYASNVVGLVLTVNLGVYWFEYVVILVACVMYFLNCRELAKSKADILKTLADFTVKRCTCFCEADRPIVYENIAEFMRITQGAAADATEEECLETFDRLVHTELPQAFLESMGSLSLPYPKVMTLALLTRLPQLLDALGGAGHGMAWRWLAALAVWYGMAVFFLVPMTLCLLDVAARGRLHLRGAQEWLWCAFSGTVVGLVMAVLMIVSDVGLYVWAVESDTGLAVFAIMDVVAGVLCASFYRAMADPRRWPLFHVALAK